MHADAGSVKPPIDIYARVSRLKRDEKREPSTEGQVAVGRARLAELGLPEGKVLIDPGRSAWNPNVKRKDWDELMHRLEHGLSGGVIVFDLERFSRQPEDGERLIKAAEHGLLVLDSESEYDLRTPNGKKAFRDAMNAAAYYSDRLSTRVRRGKRLKALGGKSNATSRSFGFEPDHVTIREAEAGIIRDLTRRFLAGETQDRLIADLDSRGVLSPGGKHWTHASLRVLLTRQRNCGRIIYRGTVVGKLPGEPIVSEEDFDRVCAIYASRRRGRPISSAYLCSGIAVCGLCGKNLHGRPRPDLGRYPDSEIKRRYWCGPKKDGRGCNRISIDQRALDAAARELAITLLSDPRHSAAIEAAAAEAASEAARLEQEIAEDEAIVVAMDDRLTRKEITLARYERIVRPIEERIRKLTAEWDVLGSPPPQPPPKATRAQWERRWDAADTKERRALLKMALRGRRLVVGPSVRARPSQADIAHRIRIEEG
jgi:site-specific DNA recombinase